jgi:hypothetical protein
VTADDRNQDYAMIPDLIRSVVLREEPILHHGRFIRTKARVRALWRIGERIFDALYEDVDAINRRIGIQ